MKGLWDLTAELMGLILCWENRSDRVLQCSFSFITAFNISVSLAYLFHAAFSSIFTSLLQAVFSCFLFFCSVHSLYSSTLPHVNLHFSSIFLILILCSHLQNSDPKAVGSSLPSPSIHPFISHLPTALPSGHASLHPPPLHLSLSPCYLWGYADGANPGKDGMHLSYTGAKSRD